MLAELSIRNFAIIESADIAFGPGLNVLTGETGAGKSILIDALGAVLGERTSTEMVRTGSRSATIDATFDLGRLTDRSSLLQALDELEIDREDGVLILSREIQSGGRSIARLNGRPTTAAILSQVGALIVDIHGQSDHLSLLRPAAQLELLDRYAQATELRARVSHAVAEWRSAKAALADAIAGSRERMQRVDLLRYQVDEIAQAQLTEGEEEDLASQHARLANVDRLSRDAAFARDLLAGSDDADEQGSALQFLRQAVSIFDDMVALDSQTEPLRERLNDSLFLLEELAADVREYGDGLESDPAQLEAIADRISLIRQLKRKYGADIAEILSFADEAEQELARLTGSEVDADVLAARERSLAEQVVDLAVALSGQRRAAAERLAAGVERSISELNMGSAEFAISLERMEARDGIAVPGDGGLNRYAIDRTGIDRATFLIAPNAGEGLKPLSRIASGGETARLMLALKSILSAVDETPTLVFDEVDVGVGGRSGQVVGEKLANLSDEHQVIAITHLPQIAAYADTHFRISKVEQEGRVISTVTLLDSAERESELAAMIDGAPVTAGALQSAREMLRRAERGGRRPVLR